MKRKRKKKRSRIVRTSAILLFVLLAVGFMVFHEFQSDNLPDDIIDTSSAQPVPAGPSQTEVSIGKVTIDPGHGTKYSRSGASGEDEIVLALAFSLREQLVRQGVKVQLTHERADRTEDLGKSFDEDNRRRANIANDFASDLCIRLHADAPSGPAAIYYPEKHPLEVVSQGSKSAAEVIWKELETVYSKAPFRRAEVIRTDEQTWVGSRQGGLLTGSIHSRVPVVLIEVAPLSKKGKEWIGEEQNMNEIAEAIARGTLRFLDDGAGSAPEHE